MRIAVAVLAAVLGSCGYQTAGKGSLLPPNLKSVSIPAFGNTTARYKLTDVMPQAFANEFIAHTRYRVVSNPGQADMILEGNILTYAFNPTIFDPVAQRANVADLRVTLQVKLVERATGKVLYQQATFEVKESYQISPDASAYFEESDLALRRASERVAQRVVTAILENF
ncbi:MAG: LPS assembly lipoprotein LptE [Acidobacteriota bacterium]